MSSKTVKAKKRVLMLRMSSKALKEVAALTSDISVLLLKLKENPESVASNNDTEESEERLSVTFVDTMYKNMWKFINLDTIKTILKLANCKTKTTHKDDVWDDDNWTKEFYNSICQKGSEAEGHYVYVNKEGAVIGTYEGKMIDDGDDGICHGAALAAALNDCGHDIGPLTMEPDPAQKTANYKTIINLYKFLIKKGWWNEALRAHFFDQVTWLDKGETKTRETDIALKTLNSIKF